MLNAVRARIRRELFLPTWLGMVVNPFHILRRGLYRNIQPLAAKVDGRVLDFGCGSKPYESLFLNATAYVGLDIAVSGHDHTGSKADVFYDGKVIPFEDGCFDGATSFETFEHVFELPAMLAELNRVIRPGGKLLISVPFVWDEHEVPYDFGRYTSFGLRYLLEKHGFEVVEYRKTTSYVETVFQMAIAYVAQHLVPKNRWLRHLSQYLIIFPMNVIAIFIGKLLPVNFNFFCNSVLLARKAEQ